MKLNIINGEIVNSSDIANYIKDPSTPLSEVNRILSEITLMYQNKYYPIGVGTILSAAAVKTEYFKNSQSLNESISNEQQPSKRIQFSPAGQPNHYKTSVSDRVGTITMTLLIASATATAVMYALLAFAKRIIR